MSDLKLAPIEFAIVDPERDALDCRFHDARVAYRGPGAWVVVNHGEVLTRHGTWVYEPLPSSRSEEFIAATRFATPELALAAFAEDFERTERMVRRAVGAAT